MRYTKWPFIQPIRKIKVASTDEFITWKNTNSIDNLADEYYGDITLGWVIMCANPDFWIEADIPVGAIIRIPLPIERVWSLWGEKSEV